MSDHASTRDDVLARYRDCRRAIQFHLDGALRFINPAMFNEAARRIGLLFGGTIVADHFGEMSLAFDLAVFGHKPGRSRAIDRYARATPFADGSLEATTLAALRADTFRILLVKGRHELAGLIVQDVARQEELWLMDEGAQASVPEGVALAGRLIRLEPFHATAGAVVPVDRDMLEDAFDVYPGRRRRPDLASFDAPRLAEAIYAAAIGSGAMGSMAYAEAG